MARSPKPSGLARRRLAPARDYGRPQKNWPTTQLVICCEGEKTERLYFEAAKRHLRLSHLRCCGGCRNVDEALEHLDEGDDAYWLFDTERPSDGRRVSDLIKECESKGVKPITSNPCFEYWLLLHFEETSSPFGGASHVVGALMAHIPEYHKSMDVYGCVCQYTDVALERAGRLRQNAVDSWEEHPNPSTDVDILVRRLMDEAKLR